MGWLSKALYKMWLQLETPAFPCCLRRLLAPHPMAALGDLSGMLALDQTCSYLSDNLVVNLPFPSESGKLKVEMSFNF